MTNSTNTSAFAGIRRALANAGDCQPLIVIDRGRLDANIDRINNDIPDGVAVRIVAKSLPSIKLLGHAMRRLDTDRLMTFNLAMLGGIAREIPDADQLLGKPFPVGAARRFLTENEGSASTRVHWLIDTVERLGQYSALAAELDRELSVSLELDVGLHRGGFGGTAGLRPALDRIASSPHLRFAGFMGYDAHVSKFPAGPIRRRAFAKSLGVYADAVGLAHTILDTDATIDAIYNGAGSPTYALHDGTTVVNEVSIGSALLKGTDFDTDLLESHQPAVYIATPVLKVLESTRLPGLEVVDTIATKLGRSTKRAVFIHGGHWLAEPEYPVGMSNNSIYGRSSNQEMFNVPDDAAIAPDDFVFLRPTQTEATLLQFGDLAVYHDGDIVDRWPVFPPSA